MATLTLYHDTRTAGQDGKSPVKMVVTHERKSMMISLGVKLDLKEWRSYQCGKLSNVETEHIGQQKKKADLYLLTLRSVLDVDAMPVAELRDRIAAYLDGKSYTGPKLKKEKTQIPTAGRKGRFVEQYERFVARRNAKGTRDLYNQTLVKIRQYQPDIDKFRFEDISKRWLNDFDTFLMQTTSSNIRNRHFRNIRAVFNDAIAEDVTAYYPFKGWKMPRLEQTRHRALSIEQIKQLRDYPCMDWQREYVDMFMLSFYLIGINMVDLLTAKKEDVRDGRLEYRRDKTGHLYSVKIEPEAQVTINKYPGKNWLLSPMDRYQDHKNYILRMNRALKKVGLHYQTSTKKHGTALFPDISSYWARHSWASIAASADIPMEIIGRALGHSWVTKNITAVYIDFDTKKVDAANRKVLDLL